MNFRTFLLFVIMATTLAGLSAQESLVGTFYGGWGRNKGDYVWISELGQAAQMITVGDANGDGYDDAITVTKGKWEVALSEAYTNMAGREVRHFRKKATWSSRFGLGASAWLSGDLDGDSRTDIAAVDLRTGSWEFQLSSRQSFIGANVHITDFGSMGDHPFFEDVNGDGRADAILQSGGDWQVCLNQGKGFEKQAGWIKGFGTKESRLFMADVNGDEKRDAIRLEKGVISVALSSGKSFQPPSVWREDVSAFEIMFADATGDGKDDLILYHMKNKDGRNLGNWEICASDGMGAFGEPELWCREHGSGDVRNRIIKTIPEAHHFLTGYVQCSRASGLGVAAIAVNRDYGFWQVMPPRAMMHGYNSAKWYNSWHTWNRGTLPRIGDEYFGFDADVDSFAIREIIKAMAEAEIDYIMMDQTNPWDALIVSYRLFAHEISRWNSEPGNRKVKYIICGKGWKGQGAVEVEESARRTMQEFVNHPVYGGPENYQFVDGKPLLVIYGGGYRKDLLWKDYKGNKSFTDQFTLKWMDGYLKQDGMDPENWGNWYGWAFLDGTYENREQMVVQPGFFNGTRFASRFVDGIEGDWYRRMNWDKVLLNKPGKVTIISLLGDMEQNDVYDMRVGDFPQEMGRTEYWSYPEMYWEMTRDYIKNYRKLRKGEIEAMGEYGWTELDGATANVRFTAPFKENPVVFVSLQGSHDPCRAELQIDHVTEDSFTIRVNGDFSEADRINWLAVSPGNWTTTNGMRVSAGRGKASSLDFAPDQAIMTCQQSPSGNNNAWIAIQTGVSKMWTGRFCTALQLEVQNRELLDFELPRYFYDRVLTLADQEGKVPDGEAGPVVVRTTNLGGTLWVPSAGDHPGGTLNVICFDGGGGCLYASEKN